MAHQLVWRNSWFCSPQATAPGQETWCSCTTREPRNHVQKYFRTISSLYQVRQSGARPFVEI